MLIDLPEKLATALKRVNWERVKERDIDFLIKIGIPYLDLKGYLKKENKTNG